MIAFIVMFVSAQNLYARESDLGERSQESLIFQMLEGNEGIVFTESRELTNNFLNETLTPPEREIPTPARDNSEFLTYDYGVLKSIPATGGDTVVPAEAIKVETDGDVDRAETKQARGPENYIVRSGDTIGGIAQRYGISINTVLWANDMTARSIIRPGQKLIILPTTGVLHTVKRGQTLGWIAKKYGSDIESIMKFNQISGANLLQIGDKLVIPGGKKITAPKPVSRSRRFATAKGAFTSDPAPPGVTGEVGKLVWPTDQKLINQYFKWNHPGIDINGRLTNKTYAVDDGTVIFSGWNRGGYGYMILIDHGNGMKTRYAHHSKLFVKAGEQVTKGQTIGMIGSTGRSTGPHLHFEIYVNGKRVNPLNYYR